MQPSQNIEAMISSFIIDELAAADPDELDLDSNLLADGTLDSISVMRLIRYIESSLEVKIPPKDLVPRNFVTIRAMSRYLDSLADDSRNSAEQRA